MLAAARTVRDIKLRDYVTPSFRFVSVTLHDFRPHSESNQSSLCWCTNACRSDSLIYTLHHKSIQTPAIPLGFIYGKRRRIWYVICRTNEAHVYSQEQIITDIISISTASAARVLLVNVVASCR